MLTKEQQIWINHLSDTEVVTVIPFDSTCEGKFLDIKDKIQSLLGVGQPVLHRGASSLKIAGQDEIDIYIPVPANNYDMTVSQISRLFGQSRSNYKLKRARFVTFIAKKHIDVFVINSEDEGWKDSERFHQHLLGNHQDLEDYRILKEMASGKSVREYYRQKIEFINDILGKI